MSTQPNDIFARLAAAEADAAALPSVLAEIAVLAATPGSFEYTHSIHLIAQSPVLASAALAEWLVTAQNMGAAAAIKYELDVAHLAGDELAPFEAARLGPAEAILVGYRLAALDAAPAVVLGWIVACLRDDVETGAERLAALLRYQAKQYPGTIRRLLESLEPGLIQRYPVVGQIRDALVRSVDAREAAPGLKELTCSSDERDILRRHRRREQRDISRRADEESVFTRLMTRSHFKYAREVALQFAADGLSVERSMRMQEHELRMELPFLEMSDPLGRKRRRLKLLRGEAP
jgi:hypothetical protein